MSEKHFAQFLAGKIYEMMPVVFMTCNLLLKGFLSLNVRAQAKKLASG